MGSKTQDPGFGSQNRRPRAKNPGLGPKKCDQGLDFLWGTVWTYPPGMFLWQIQIYNLILVLMIMLSNRKSVFSSDISFDLMDLGLFGFDPTSSKQIYWYCNGIETEGPLVRRS